MRAASRPTSASSPTTCSKAARPARAATTWPRCMSRSAIRAIGLAPAGDDGSYFQRVPMLRGVLQADGNELVINRDGAQQCAARSASSSCRASTSTRRDAHIEAPAVFVGQGVYAPELEHDDFAGVDVKGRIAVMFDGAPARFDNDRRAFYSSTPHQGTGAGAPRRHRRGPGADRRRGEAVARGRAPPATGAARRCACAAPTARASTPGRSCG